jgi:phosphatidylglycerophosphate synthase
MSVAYQDPTRQLTSVLAPVEKRVLVWLAERMPRRINSDHLTILALAAMLGAGLSYWWASVNALGLIAATICLAVNWFGDSLDGTLARFRRRCRPRYGFYVDHMVDAFGALFLLGGMAWSGYMSPAVAIAVLLAYFLMSIHVYLATHTLGVFKIAYGGLGGTELRLILAAGNVVATMAPRLNVAGASVLVFDVVGGLAAVGLVVTLVLAVARSTRQLYQLERL